LELLALYLMEPDKRKNQGEKDMASHPINVCNKKAP
jgi:hypothetical protein